MSTTSTTTSTTTSSSTSSSSTSTSSSSTTTTTYYPVELALCTVDDVRNYLQQKGVNAEEETLIEGLIDSVGKMFANYCNVDGFEDTVYTEFFSGESGQKAIFPRNVPVTEVMYLYDDPDRLYPASTLIAAEDYAIVQETWVELDGTLGSGVNNIMLNYRGGFVTIPEDLKQAAIEQTAWKHFHESKNHNLGIDSKTLSDGTNVSYQGSVLLPGVKQTLQPYRRIDVG